MAMPGTVKDTDRQGQAARDAGSESAHEARREAIALASLGFHRRALIAFEQTLCYENDPQATSYYALCIGVVRKEYDRALELCAAAAKREFYNPDIYLNAGRIFLEKGRKDLAYKAFRKGLMMDESHAVLVDAVKRLGIRKPPPVPFLPRQHVVNKYLGLAAGRLEHIKGRK